MAGPFAAIAPVIGCAAAETGWIGPGSPPRSGQAATIQPLVSSWRNVPIYSTIGKFDTDCNTTAQRPIRQAIDRVGYRYEWREYPGEHVTGAIEPALAEPAQYTNFLRGRTVPRNPAHVSYVYNVRADQRRWGLRADHVYWLSDLKARSTRGAAPRGTIDVLSRGFGEAPPIVNPTEPTVGPGYTGQRKTWRPARSVTARNVLEIKATNISAVTIDVRRARVTCHPTLHVKSDGPITITLAGCRR